MTWKVIKIKILFHKLFRRVLCNTNTVIWFRTSGPPFNNRIPQKTWIGFINFVSDFNAKNIIYFYFVTKPARSHAEWTWPLNLDLRLTIMYKSVLWRIFHALYTRFDVFLFVRVFKNLSRCFINKTGYFYRLWLIVWNVFFLFMLKLFS